MLPIQNIYKTTCSYCGVGCGIEIQKNRRGELTLRGDPSHPSNKGLLCAKGASLLHIVNNQTERLLFPMLRTSRNTPHTRATWLQTMEHIAKQFRDIQNRHGKNAVGFYISGQCLTEEYYLANKIVKGFLGTNNIDTNSRLCMSSAVCGYKMTLGSDAPPVSYEDIEHCDTFFITGANPAWCHPILFRRIEARKTADPDVKIIVVDPRRTATATLADIYLPIKPGTDVALYHGIARELWATGQWDESFLASHVDGTMAYLEAIKPWTLDRTARECDIPESLIRKTACYLGGKRRFLSMWTMGLNQSAVGTDKNIALIQISLITGKIGKPGCGPFSLTGQPNAMGGREVGGMATLLAAHRDLSNHEHRAAVAKYWDVPDISPIPGKTAVEMFTALSDGKMKAIWIIATNPVASLPQSQRIEQALEKAEFVVVQDIYSTETTAYADAILPAASWLEKTGTMTNSERRISLLQQVVTPPGEARADAEILLDFARSMGWQSHFSYSDTSEIFREYTQLTKGCDIDISGLSYQHLLTRGTVQWPYPENSSNYGTTRLYTDARFPTPNGRAQLYPIAYKQESESLSSSFPLILTTGRIRDQWHTMTKTGKVNKLRQHQDVPICEMHHHDALQRGLKSGDIVTVQGRHGSVQVQMQCTEDIRPGVIFLPMHWGKKLGGIKGRTNNITSSKLDPQSKEPDLKYAAVEVTKVRIPARKIVIVGAGTAAWAFIEKHRLYNTNDEICLLGEESTPIYNRVLLPHYLDQSNTWDSLIRADYATIQQQGVQFFSGTRVLNVDREQQWVHDDQQRKHPYDILIIATGSRPNISYQGKLPAYGVFTIRSRQDTDRLIEAAQKTTQVVIVGGGLLGLELAGALVNLGKKVTILQRSTRLMGKQLDIIAAGHLYQLLIDRGVEILFNSTLSQVNSGVQVSHVEVTKEDGARITCECEMIIFTTGINPNKELAENAGIPCQRGILVNEYLQTSDSHLFAIGECAQFGELSYGTTPAAVAQAESLAEYLRGNNHAPYRGTVPANILKVDGIKLASAGIVEPPSEDYETITLHDPKHHRYQKLVVHHDHLVGAICLGDTSNFSQYLEWIEKGLELDDKRSSLLSPGSGTSGVKGRLICSCHQIGDETLNTAIQTHHGDLSQVCRSTKAGTACGSCKPEIQKLIQTLNCEAVPSGTLRTSLQCT